METLSGGLIREKKRKSGVRELTPAAPPSISSI